MIRLAHNLMAAGLLILACIATPILMQGAAQTILYFSAGSPGLIAHAEASR